MCRLSLAQYRSYLGRDGREEAGEGDGGWESITACKERIEALYYRASIRSPQALI